MLATSFAATLEATSASQKGRLKVKPFSLDYWALAPGAKAFTL
jgi:hypothetical protein